MKTRHLFLSISFFLIISNITSGQNFNSDRPGAGDGVATVELRYFQVEAGLDFSKSNSGKINEFSTNSLPILLLRYGLTDKAELRLSESFVINDLPNMTGDNKTSGLTNLVLGGKFRICERPEWGTKASILAEIFIPTGSKDVAGDELGLSIRLLHSWDFSEGWNLSSNIGTYWFEEQDLSFLYNFAIGYAISNKLGAYVGPYGNYFEMNDFSVSFEGGFSYLLKPDLQVDISAGTGITDDHLFIGLGFSWLIGKI